MSIDEMRAGAAAFDLLTHSFYQRWSAGDLSVAELRDYACQYNFVVAAMPGWLDRAAAADPRHRDVLGRHAREETPHIEMWADFAGAVGLSRAELDAARPNDATRRLLDLGDELVSRGLGAAAVWALEEQTPRVSVSKLAGLPRYGVEPGGGTRYFEVHQSMDVRHAAELETVVSSMPDGAEPGAAATAMARALWDLLTSVEGAVALA